MNSNKIHIKFGRFCILFLIFLSLSNLSFSQTSGSYVIQKENGKIILAYKAFEDFLNSNKGWESYKSILLDAYPAVLKVHNRQIEWGNVDSLKFPDEVRKYNKKDYDKYLNQYSMERINYLYDSVIENAHKVLPPFNKKDTDLCFFLPYGGCFVIPEENVNTIYISLLINPADAEKIMAHEYAHVLHIQRRPEESLTLKRELISEGMAVYLTNKILKNIKVSNSIPFMPEESFRWCMENEKMIKDSVKLELNDSTMNLFKRYISDGSFAEPPSGFVEKTGYFIGYKIIESCIKKGILLEEICAMNSDEVIKRSGYFDN